MKSAVPVSTALMSLLVRRGKPAELNPFGATLEIEVFRGRIIGPTPNEMARTKLGVDVFHIDVRTAEGGAGHQALQRFAGQAAGTESQLRSSHS